MNSATVHEPIADGTLSISRLIGLLIGGILLFMVPSEACARAVALVIEMLPTRPRGRFRTRIMTRAAWPERSAVLVLR
jgi:hypothetical protein